MNTLNVIYKGEIYTYYSPVRANLFKLYQSQNPYRQIVIENNDGEVTSVSLNEVALYSRY